MSDETTAGVHFPADDQGKRSTTTTTKGVLPPSPDRATSCAFGPGTTSRPARSRRRGASATR